MRYTYTDAATGALFRLHVDEPTLGRDFFSESAEHPLTIIWNRGSEPQPFRLDAVPHALGPQEVLALNTNQTFAFAPADTLVAWQFNREFYCIADHDQEISCSGLLFYGTREGLTTVHLDPDERLRFVALLDVFEDEFRERDKLQGEMLHMLLKRLIVKTTRLYKRQHVAECLSTPELDLIRKFGLLVEHHYREFRRVQDYARLLHKSPKTLANLFGQHSTRTPQQIIQDRVALEAKRMLSFTQASVAEIGYAVGFGEPAHFSRFFKSVTGESPAAYRKAQLAGEVATVGV